MSIWKDDGELFELIRRNLFTAVVGDILDANGFTNQFLPPQIQALRQDMIVVGRAMPVREADWPLEQIGQSERGQPFGLMFQALDSLKENEVYVSAGSSQPYALWGELMSTRAMQLGAVGAVLDGYSRDTRDILRLNFPTFSWGRYGQDQRPRGRVIDFRCPVEFSNGVRVHPGDIVFGDMDGVVTLPQTHEAEVVQLALNKVQGENTVRKAIEAGMSASAAFEKYGVM